METTWSHSESPPDLQPANGESGSGSAGDVADVGELLLRILSRLTVYQSLPETPGLVLAVKDDVSMLDACCLLLPTQSTGVIEVVADQGLYTATDESPSSRSSKLLELSSSRSDDDFIFARALEQEAARVTSAVASDSEIVDPVGDYLSSSDVFFFLRRLSAQSGGETMTVRDWLNFKRQTTFSPSQDLEWNRFCETSMLVTRSSMNLSQGVGHNQVISGSTMNMSSSSLISMEVQQESTSGGSCLQAVNQLLSRPWQSVLPLTVSTEKGISAILGYTSLKQLMAHVSMNCSDRRLEPFFTDSIDFEAIRANMESNLNACAMLDYDEATIEDAIEVMAVSSLSLLVSSKFNSFHRLVTSSDICELIGTRMDNPECPRSARLKDNLEEFKLAAIDDDAVRESDFPITLSFLLQKLLMSRADAIVVLSADEVPVGLITCRDVWAYVMQGGGSDQ